MKRQNKGSWQDGLREIGSVFIEKRLIEKALRYIQILRKVDKLNDINVFQFVLNTTERSINWINRRSQLESFFLKYKEQTKKTFNNYGKSQCGLAERDCPLDADCYIQNMVL